MSLMYKRKSRGPRREPDKPVDLSDLGSIIIIRMMMMMMMIIITTTTITITVTILIARQFVNRNHSVARLSLFIRKLYNIKNKSWKNLFKKKIETQKKLEKQIPLK